MLFRRLQFGLGLLVLTAACGRFGLSSDSKKKDTGDGDKLPDGFEGFNVASLDRYASCDALKVDLQAKLQAQMTEMWESGQYYKTNPQVDAYEDADMGNDGGGGDDAGSAPTAAESGSDDDSSSKAETSVSTNLQEAGIDEPDDIKMNETAIYIADNQQNPGDLTVAVITKKPLAVKEDIIVKGLTGPQLYTVGDALVVTGMQSGQELDGEFKSEFAIKVYDLKSGATVKHEHSLPSRPVDSRMIGGKLFAVLQETLQMKKNLPYPTEADLNGTYAQYVAQLKVDETFDFTADSISGLKCTSMLKLSAIGSRFEYQRVIAYDTATGQVLDEVAIPGQDSTIYMTERTLYSIGTPSYEYKWISPEDTAANEAQAERQRLAQDTLVIKKVGIDGTTGKLTPTALGSVRGHLKQFDGQWAFHEIVTATEVLLAVVTSTGDIRDQTGTNPASNHLVVLRQQEQNLVEAASLKDFGKNEDVRSVRYAGDMAYVVTFKRTDPLFAIDLKDPLAPKIAGELKIPGFSMYMHPHAAGRLLGLGFQTEESDEPDIDRAFFQGVLFQLFDVANPAAPTRLNFVELGKRGSYSEANQDHHAFYYDAENSLAGVPVVLFNDGKEPNEKNGQQNHTTREFSGAIFYKIQDAKLEEVKRVSHFDIIGATCKTNLQPLSWTVPVVANPEVRRIFRTGDVIYAVSNFGVTTFDAKTYADLETVKLDRPDCRPMLAGGAFE